MTRTVAAVIPARNAAVLLYGCVAALDRQDHPADEVWIAVGASNDGTATVAAELASTRLSIRVIDNSSGDRASALNLAIRRTDADVLAFVDAQATLAPDYLSAALRALAETDAAVVGGPMRPVGQTLVGQAMAAALQSPFGVGDSQFHFEGRAREVPSVYLGVYRAEVFRRVGVYNTALLRTEDDDFNARLRDQAMRIWLDPAIRSTYRCRDTLREISTQYYGYGFWKVALAAVRPGALRLRHFVPVMFLIALIGGLVAGPLGFWWLFGIVVGAWLATAVVFALRVPGVSPGVRLVFPVVTLTMHVAYGVGTLLGLLRLPSVGPRVRTAGALAEAERSS